MRERCMITCKDDYYYIENNAVRLCNKFFCEYNHIKYVCTRRITYVSTHHKSSTACLHLLAISQDENWAKRTFSLLYSWIHFIFCFKKFIARANYARRQINFISFAQPCWYIVACKQINLYSFECIIIMMFTS
jgi:hypothetical protein